MLRFMGLQSQTQLSNWTELNWETWLRKRYDVVVVQLLSHVWLFVTPWTIAHQASLSMGFSRQQYWSGCNFLLQGIFPTQGLNLHLLLGRWVLYHWATREAPKIQCGGVILGQGSGKKKIKLMYREKQKPKSWPSPYNGKAPGPWLLSVNVPKVVLSPVLISR